MNREGATPSKLRCVMTTLVLSSLCKRYLVPLMHSHPRGITLRSRGRCAIKLRSAPDLQVRTQNLTLPAFFPQSLVQFMPSHISLRRFVYTVVVCWLLWFAFLSALSCTDGCSATFVVWAFAACLPFGFSFACFCWALAATASCISTLISKRSAFAWVGSWPEPIGAALMGWLGHVFGLLLFQLFFSASGTIAPFVAWYLGFLPSFIK